MYRRRGSEGSLHDSKLYSLYAGTILLSIHTQTWIKLEVGPFIGFIITDDIVSY